MIDVAKKSGKVLCFYAVIVAALLAPALFTSEILLPGDILASLVPWAGHTPQRQPQNALLSDALEVFYPSYFFLQSEIKQRRLPLWNPYVLAGAPFLADSVPAVFSPLHWLLLIVPINLYWEWSAFLKLFLAGTGIYFYCLRIGIAKKCSMVAGASYIFAGYNIYFLLFPNSWVPSLFGWGLLALEDFLQTGRRRNLCLFCLIVAFGYLGGQAQNAALHHLAYGLYALLRNWKRLAAVVAASLLGFGLAAVAMFPFIESLFRSAAYLERSLGGRNPYTVAMVKWPALLLPYFTGSPLYRSDVTAALMEGAVYLGMIPVFLSVVAVFNRDLRRWTWPLLALGVGTLSLVFGVPVVFDLVTLLPVLRQANLFHSSSIFQASGAILAGIGLAAIENRTIGKNRFVGAAGAVGLLFVLAAYWQIEQALRGEASFFFFFRYFRWPLYLLWVAGSFAILIGFFSRPSLPRVALALVVANGLLFGTFFNPATPAHETVDVVPPIIEKIKAFDHVRIAAVGVGALPPNYGMRWELRDVRGYVALADRRVPPVFAKLTGAGSDHHYFIADLDGEKLALLRRFGCGLVLSAAPLDLEGLELISGQSPFLYRVVGGERAHWARAVLTFASEPDPESASLQHVLTEPDATLVALESSSDTAETALGSGEISWQLDWPDLVALEVAADKDSWLVLRDLYAPGWRASIDGKDVPIERADYLFRAVRVTAGSHRVRFEYKPFSFRLGLAVSLISLVVVTCLWLSDRQTTEPRATSALT